MHRVRSKPPIDRRSQRIENSYDCEETSLGETSDLNVSSITRDVDVAGFVLAGGQSARMGTDKALVPLAGQPLVAHALAILREAGFHVHADDGFSRSFPNQMPARIRIALRGGRTLLCEKTDYEGFYTRPMAWNALVTKFERLTMPFTRPELRREIVSAVSNIESTSVRELTGLLARAGRRN